MSEKDGEFDVGGVRLARPFKLLRLGHFGVNATDPEEARDFYCRILGFRVKEFPRWPTRPFTPADEELLRRALQEVAEPVAA